MVWLKLAVAVGMMGLALMIGGGALGWWMARYRLHAVQASELMPELAARTGPVYFALLAMWTLGWGVLSVLLTQGGGHPPALLLLPGAVGLWLLGAGAFLCYRVVLRRVVAQGLRH